MEKKDEKITMLNMITQIIQDDQLFAGEEEYLMNVLQERAMEREEEEEQMSFWYIRTRDGFETEKWRT